MDTLIARLQRTDCCDIQETGYGFVLIRRVDRDDEFTSLVRQLRDWSDDDYVVLPVTDGRPGYERAVLLPLATRPRAVGATLNPS